MRSVAEPTADWRTHPRRLLMGSVRRRGIRLFALPAGFPPRRPTCALVPASSGASSSFARPSGHRHLLLQATITVRGRRAPFARRPVWPPARRTDLWERRDNSAACFGRLCDLRVSQKNRDSYRLTEVWWTHQWLGRSRCRAFVLGPSQFPFGGRSVSDRRPRNPSVHSRSLKMVQLTDPAQETFLARRGDLCLVRVRRSLS